MSDEAALLRAIRAARDDDTPRLVYADWLDDHGDPARAEFVRVQCWLSANPTEHPDWRRHAARETELLAEHRERWDAPLKGYINFYGRFYDRGFPSWFSVHEPDTFAAYASELIDMTAIDRLRIGWSTDRNLVPLLLCPGLKDIRELQVSVENQSLSEHAVEQLLTCGFAQRLRRLDFTGTQYSFDQADALFLTRNPVLPDLEHIHLGLELRYGGTVEPVLMLIESAQRQRLRGLGMPYLSESAAVELARCPSVSRFTHLDLTVADLSDTTVIALASSPFLERIQLLTLIGENNRTTRRGRDALRDRFEDRVELDPAVCYHGPVMDAHYYRTVTGRRA